VNAPIIAFRADASVDIGLGHVMRCLTLASVLQENGARCHFLCRDLPGHLAATIRARGVECHLLPAADAPEDDGTTAHSRWLGVSSKRDAAQSREVLDRLSPDWLVVDHYALDATWERATRPDGARLLVVDDLANRPHECEILLDQNLGRDARDYTGLVEDRCALLIGPTYALLRPEFAAHRAASLARRKAHRLAHILVSLGGVDRDDVTSRVLDTLAACPLPADSRITVVLGPSAPAREPVARRAAQMPVPTKLCIGADNMAAMMTEADLAIGAGGSTSWERCCQGLPTLLAVLAENQAPAAKALAEAGAAIRFGDASDPVKGLADAMQVASDPDSLAAMAGRAAGLVDGLGANRVMTEMEAYEIGVRRAHSEDAEPVYFWRYADGAARHYRASSVPSLVDHTRWFAAALDDPSRVLLITTWRGKDVGHVRLDLDLNAQDRATISICLNPAIRGGGRSVAILNAALRHGSDLGLRSYRAEIHEDNVASRRLFQQSGFSEIGCEGPFRQYLAKFPVPPAFAPATDRSMELQ